MHRLIVPWMSMSMCSFSLKHGGGGDDIEKKHGMPCEGHDWIISSSQAAQFHRYNWNFTGIIDKNARVLPQKKSESYPLLHTAIMSEIGPPFSAIEGQNL